MADANHIDACNFIPTEEQAALVGAPERPGKIGDPGTNIELCCQSVAEAQIRQGCSFPPDPRIIFRFANELWHPIDAEDPEMQER